MWSKIESSRALQGLGLLIILIKSISVYALMNKWSGRAGARLIVLLGWNNTDFKETKTEFNSADVWFVAMPYEKGADEVR